VGDSIWRHETGNGPLAGPAKTPQANVGTGTVDRSRWGPLVARFISDLISFDFAGAPRSTSAATSSRPVSA
jgi:hypothetical protein